jgi:hypothetical protein
MEMGLSAGMHDYLVGSVAVGLTIVPGVDFPISSSENQKIISQAQSGLEFLVESEPDAQISFHYKIPTISPVNAAPCSDPENDSYEQCEKPWRDQALAQLGYANTTQYANAIKSELNTDWAYIAYFTKYPLHHFAYQYGDCTVMNYDNDGWGPDKINIVFAHESCHVFGAKDEYGTCTCGGSYGYLGVPNNNCVNCTGPDISCLMKHNTLFLCQWSRGQVGWQYWTWGKNINSSDSASGGVSATIFQNMMMIAWKNGSGNAMVSSNANPNSTWPAGTSLGSNEYPGATPGIGTFGSNVYLAWPNKYAANLLTIASSSNGTSFSKGKAINNYDACNGTPAMVEFNGKFYMAWSSSFSGDLLTVSSTTDPMGTWPNGVPIQPYALSGMGPALIVYNGTLYMFWSDRDSANQVFMSSSTNGSTWTKGVAVHKNAISYSTPSVAIFNRKLNLVYRSHANLLNWTSTDNPNTWKEPVTIGNLNSSGQMPGLVGMSNNMYVGFNPDYGGNILISQYNKGMDG